MSNWINAREVPPPENSTIEARVVNRDGSIYGDIICERIGQHLFYVGYGQVVITAASPYFTHWRLSDGVSREVDGDI